ncbi:hypothetical protein [Vibrio rotiferianus]|uniref:hypothetical protein n=1 Tax=Vibrio rotiferianus TaxID=190895 RepID=UPI002491502D|nr:hypothetical protein [Vibrio rotiferianus]
MKFDQKTLLAVACVLGGVKYIAIPALERYDNLAQQYSSVNLRYDKSVSAIEQTQVYKDKIAQYKNAIEGLENILGEPVNIDSFKLEVQEKVGKILLKHGLVETSFGWKQDLEPKVSGIYSGTLSLRFGGKTAALILAMTELESLAKVSKLEQFSQTLQGYQTDNNDLGLGNVSLDITIWVRGL